MLIIATIAFLLLNLFGEIGKVLIFLAYIAVPFVWIIAVFGLYK
jgi:hypothetical protein